MATLNRRQFLHTSGAVSSIAPLILVSQSGASPNERINHAVIGAGGQGKTHCNAIRSLAELAQITAVCDVDPVRRQAIAQHVGIQSESQIHDDYRRILDDKSIDTVSITTPDHWHTKIAMEAILAGKQVYVEKPCCHNILEGMQLVKLATMKNTCVQHGTQSRSGEGIKNAIEFLHSGKLGKIRIAKAINHQLRGPIGKALPESPPDGVNYDRWLGPAPEHAFTRNRWHYNWHWFWDYGTGDIGNDGIHQIDVARWGLGVQFPLQISASGGQLFYEDDHETPDTQTVIYDFGHCHLMYEMRLWTDYKMEGHDNGTVFYGENGRLDIGREGCLVTWKDGPQEKIGGGSDLTGNFRNFLECVKNNTPQHLNAPIAEGLASAALPHLGNIAVRVQSHLRLAPQSYQILENPSANALLGRDYRKGYELPQIG